MQNIIEYAEQIRGLSVKSNKSQLKIHQILLTIEATEAWKSKKMYEGQSDFDYEKYSIMSFHVFIKEAFGNAQDPNSDDVIEVVTIAACEQRFEAKARVSQAKENKKLASEVKASGMTYQEAIAAMKTLAALKAKGIDLDSL